MYEKKPVEKEPPLTDEESVYEDESRSELVEDDEITPEESGFMQGYESEEPAPVKEEEEEEESFIARKTKKIKKFISKFRRKKKV
ncbi:MAG: hypothetical protein V1837_04480 [Candidatus Woesearchaeota archaeon]